MSTESNTRTVIKDLVSGTFGGIAQTLVGMPLDTVKVRLQTQSTLPGQKPQFNGMVDCFRKTVAQEGVAGLYKGMASPMWGAMALNATLFFSFGQATKVLAGGKADAASELSLTKVLLAGGIAGACAATVESPMDLLKVKMQAQVGKGGAYKGVFDAARKILAGHGPRGLYQGFSGTLVRNTPAFAFYFWGYELSNRMLTPENGLPSLAACFVSGGVGGFAFWGTVYPLEMVKTRLQADSLDPSKRLYKGWLDCWTKTLREQGVKGLFRGYIPCVVRAVPVNGVVFATVAGIKRSID